MVGAECQQRIGNDREEAAARDQSNARGRRVGDHRSPGKIKPAGTKSLDDDRAEQTIRRWQCPRFIHKVGKLYSTASDPGISCSTHDDKWLIVENFCLNTVLNNRFVDVQGQQIDFSLLKGAACHIRIGNQQVKENARIPPCELTEDAVHEACGNDDRSSDPQLPYSRVGEELDVLHGLLQLIERDHAAIKE